MQSLQDNSLTALSQILLTQQHQQDLSQRGEKIKKVLLLLAKGSALIVAVSAPRALPAFKNIVKNKSNWSNWKEFNLTYLRKTIKKLEQQKLVTIDYRGDEAIIGITENGKRKVFKYGLDDMSINKPGKWDGKWRLVVYDVIHGKRSVRDEFRKFLQKFGFYQLQESVYLHAFPCEKEIEFLKYYLGIGGEVRTIITQKIENDQAFREFFGID